MKLLVTAISRLNKLDSRQGDKAKSNQARFDSTPQNVGLVSKKRMATLKTQIDRSLAESVVKNETIS